MPIPAAIRAGLAPAAIGKGEPIPLGYSLMLVGGIPAVLSGRSLYISANFQSVIYL